MLRLKFQYFGHIMRRTDSLEKTLMLGKTEGEGDDRGRDGWMVNGHEFEQAPGGGEGQGSLACCSPWSHKESDTTERLNNKGKDVAVSGTALKKKFQCLGRRVYHTYFITDYR